MTNMGGLRDPKSPYTTNQQEQWREEVARGVAASNRPGSWKVNLLLTVLVAIIVGVGLFFVYFH